jgi:hypothetical protein
VGLSNLGSESETCVGSRIRLVGVFISFEKNFLAPIHSPPLWFAVSVLQAQVGALLELLLCLCISSKVMNSYIPNPCDTLSVFLQASFKWCHLRVIPFPSGSSQHKWQQGREEHPPEVYNAPNLQVVMLQELSRLISCHLSYLFA